MTLDQLRYFIAAAEFGNLGRAAREVAISTSAISTAVAKLEAELGSKLFERRGKRLLLLPAGEAFKLKSERLLNDAEKLKSEFKSGTVSLSGRYRIAASHFLAHRVLALAWNDVQTIHPELVGEISSIETRSVLHGVLDSRFDFGLCFSPVRHNEISEIKIYEGEQRIGVRKGHSLLSRGRGLKLSALSEYPAALHRITDAHDLPRDFPVLKAFGIVSKTSVLYDNGDIAVQKLKNSEAWSLLPDLVLKEFSKEIKVLPRPRDWHSPIWVSAILHNRRRRDPVLETLIEAIRKRLPKTPVKLD